jgi:hypothetical protein
MACSSGDVPAGFLEAAGEYGPSGLCLRAVRQMAPQAGHVPGFDRIQAHAANFTVYGQEAWACEDDAPEEPAYACCGVPKDEDAALGRLGLAFPADSAGAPACMKPLPARRARHSHAGFAAAPPLAFRRPSEGPFG